MASTQSGKKLDARRKRHIRIRKKIFGTVEKPRLSVFRSARHVYAQVVDDVDGRTLAAASSLTKSVQEAVKDNTEGGKTTVAFEVGKALASLCKEKSIDAVSFDRAGFRYHGRVRALAEGAREGGLQF